MKPNQQSELAVVPHESGAVVKHDAQSLTIEQVFAAVIEKNISAEHISVMKELLAMDAVKKFNSAFAKLQSELPVIIAESIIPNRGKYAKFEFVMAKITKPLSENGFSISFTNDCIDNRVIETCTLRHVGGHSQSNRFAVRVGKADSETQADCKAATTAKRNALLNCLNIVVAQDCMTNEDDIAMEGDPDAKITPEQADELEHRLQLVNGRIADFLAYAKAKSFIEIAANKYDELDKLLQRKEQQGK